MRWIQSKNEITYVETINDKKEKTYPTNRIRIPIDKNAVLESGLVKPKDADLIVPYIDITIDEQGLTKNRIMMLDILANNNWKHPIYFTGGAAADDEYIWLKDYLQMDGLAYKFVPIRTPLNNASLFDMGRIDSDLNYDYWTSRDWRNIDDGKIYIDPETRKNAVSYRNNMMRLVDTLIAEEDPTRAEEILDMSMTKLPIDGFLHYGMLLGFPEAYYRINKTEKAREVTIELLNKFEQHLVYYSQFKGYQLEAAFDEIENNLIMYDQLVKVTTRFDETEYSDELQNNYVEILKLYSHILDE